MPSMATRSRSCAPMGSVANNGSRRANSGELAILMLAANVPLLVVPPATLKKFVAGKGNAKKDTMRLETFKRWKYEHPSDNIVDAYGLAKVGLACAGGPGALTKQQKEVVNVLKRQTGPLGK